jgi:exosortase family protein XrtF
VKDQKRVILFIASAIGLYLAWYVVYDFWLKPDGRLDQGLTVNVAQTGAKLLQGLGYDAHVEQQSRIFIGQKSVIRINHPCNGLELYALFTGFVLIYPGAWKKKILFIPFGISIIYLLNLVRISVLVLNFMYSKRSFDFNHKYVYTFLVYLAIFGLWMLWVNRFSRTRKLAFAGE